MDLIDRDLSSSRVTAILGRRIDFDSRVRVTGILALDCGHGWLHNCDEDDAGTQNQEIHPMYALDFVQNFHLPRPFALLTGVWSGDDAGTYYLREVDNTVWWLGLSVDEGRTFANVFRGTFQNGQVSGQWTDVPLGQTSNAGTLVVAGDDGDQSSTLQRISETGGFSGASWEKLYDVGGRTIVVVFEGAVANGPSWPNTPDPFELVVDRQRVEAQPAIPHATQAPGMQPSTQADLDARILIKVREGGPLHMAARYAGYRANWTITDIKPGVYIQSMSAPRALPPATPLGNKGEVTDRDRAFAKVTGRSVAATALPAYDPLSHRVARRAALVYSPKQRRRRINLSRNCAAKAALTFHSGKLRIRFLRLNRALV
jgi:hypothetical protein